MTGPLRRFLTATQVTPAQAAMVLRGLYLAMFGGQFAVAMLAGFALAAFFPPAPAQSALLGWVLVLFALPHLPLSMFLATRGLQGASRGSAVSATVMSAVLLSTPAWFLSLGLATRQPLPPLLALLAVLASGYAAGMFLVGRFARLAIPADGSPEDGDGPRD